MKKIKKNNNISHLEEAIAGAIWSGGFASGEPAILSNARHKELIDKALTNMLSVKRAIAAVRPPEIITIDLKEALHALGLVIGKSVSDDILDRIFERFCIGK